MFYVLLLVNIFYVCAEFLFNFILLNTASTQVDINDIHAVEILGRSLAAFGFTFIFWKLIESKNIKTLKKVFLMTIVSLIAYPSFYYGQEKLVNSLAENSSLETREKIHDLFLLKQGLVVGALQLDSIPYSEEIKDLPESKTFISNLPLFMLGNDAVSNFLKENRKAVAANVFKTDVLENPSKYLDFYNNSFNKPDYEYIKYSSFYGKRSQDMKIASEKVKPGFDKMQKDLYWYYKRDKEGKASGISFETYVNKSKVKDQVIERIKKEHGITLKRNFNPAKLKSMENAFAMTVYDKYADKKKEMDKEIGFSIPDNLSRMEFKSHPEVIKKLKKEMGDFYDDELYRSWLNLGKSEKDMLIIMKNHSDAIGLAFSKNFVNQDLMSNDVTSIVKAMIVPPIALILSLSFAFINIFILIKSISNKIMVGRIKNAKMYSNVLVTVLVFCLFILPASLSNKYVESEAYKKVYDKMSDHNIIMAVSVDWIMKLEPFVYKSGSKFIEGEEMIK